MQSEDLRRYTHRLLTIAGMALVYFVLARLSVALFVAHGLVSVIWLPSGFALGALLLWGKHCTWAIFLGEFFFVFFESALPLEPALLIASADALSLLLSAWLMMRKSWFNLSLRSLRSYLHLIFVAGSVGGILSGLLGVYVLQLWGQIEVNHYAHALLEWWAGYMVGIVLVTPLLLVWRTLPKTLLNWAVWLENGIVVGLAVLLGQVVLLGWFANTVGLYAMSYWLFALVVWIAMRQGRRIVTLILPIFALQGLLGGIKGVGLFANDVILHSDLINYSMFVIVLACVGMIVASYVTELTQTQSDLVEREDAYHRQFSDNTVAMLLTRCSDGKILDANQAAVHFYGYATRPQMQALSIYDISCRDAADIRARLDATSGTQSELRHRMADGSMRDVAVSISPMVFDNQRVFHAIVVDITDRKRAEEEIENLAFFDPLTHLPNRRLLLDRLRQALAASARSHQQGALLFIDLDNFKALNDNYGHEKGDVLLLQTAMRLSDCIRVGDTVARLGGDEFVVMLKDLSANTSEAAAQVESVSAKVLAALTLPYPLGGVEHQSSGSVGIALFGGTHGNHTNLDYPTEEMQRTVDELFRRADLALYQAKAMGRNTVCFFDPTMQAAMTERHALEVDLRIGLKQDQLVLHYQAQVNAQGHLCGAEVLVRWLHPQRGMVLPSQFIAIAEETGLIVPLGQWVLKTACTQLADWAGQPATAHLTLSVNVSARQFRQPTFVQDVLDVLHCTGAPALQLKLELTESTLVDDVEDVIAKMMALKAQGVGFALDDFGTGYSSLSYLKRLPLDQLKIDQTFVRDALIDPNDAAITKTIVALGKSLGLNVIAEGVETQAQRDFLWQNGCYAYQGYFFGRPGTVEALLSLL